MPQVLQSKTHYKTLNYLHTALNFNFFEIFTRKKGLIFNIFCKFATLFVKLLHIACGL